MVIPAVRQAEGEWFLTQLQALNSDGLIPYAELVPLRAPFPAVVRWAPWGKTMWRYHRAWCLARITGCFPLVAWGRSGFPCRLDCCSLCGTPQADLRHVLAQCPLLLSYRVDLRPGVVDFLPQWALAHTDDIAVLQERVRFFGLCEAAVVCNLPML